MEEHENKGKRIPRQARYFAGAALLLGILSTLRRLGVDGVPPAAAVLLSVALVFGALALIPLVPRGTLQQDRRRALLVFLFGVHLIATLFFFTPEDLLNDRPVVTLDHALHYYQAARARDIFWKSLKLHSYDPNFMAGYPGGAIFDLDMKAAELFCAMIQFWSVARTLKLFILLALLTMVFTLYGGCRRLGYRFEESLFGTLLFLAYWHWGRPYAGHFRFAGMFSFVFVSHISFYLTGQFRTFLQRKRSLGFFILGPLVFLIHPTAVIPLAVPFLVLFLAQRGWQRDRLLRLAAWCLAVVAVNAIWLVPLFRYMDIRIPSEIYFQIRGLRGLVTLLARPGNIPALVILMLSIVGLRELILEKRLVEGLAPGAGAVAMLSVSCFGIYLPVIDQLEPGRFIFSAFVFLAPFSGVGFAALIRGFSKLFRSGRLLDAARGAAILVLFLCAPVLALVESRSYYKHTLRTTLRPDVNALVEAVKRYTDASGRLMIEDGPAWIYGGCHLPAMLPILAGVEQIGGPYPHTYVKHHFASFQRDRALGKPLARLSSEEFLDYLDLYNVHWVISATAETGAFLSRLPRLEAIWSKSHYTLWGVRDRSTFASESGVSVTAAQNWIRVRMDRDQPPPEMVMIKYHWDRGLGVEAPSRISPVVRMDDPVPLIELQPNGATDIRITFR